MNFARGAILLKPRRKDSAPGPVRLVFSKKDEALPLPPGVYRVKNYTIETTHEGTYWALSGSGMHGKVVRIRRGKASTLEIDSHVRLNVVASRTDEGVGCCAIVQGDGDMGLTVIRDTKRVPISFEVRDRDGKRIDGTDMTYN